MAGFSKEQELEMIRLYVDEQKNTKEIGNIFNTYNTSIRRVLLRNNIKLRTASEVRRVVNLDDIKSKEGTPDFDYFIGLLATDGCITGDRVILDFSEANKELLNYWNEFLGNKCKITCSFHKKFQVPQYRITFRNQDICDYFYTFGIIPRKTNYLVLNYINWNVLRGIIDGDGCVSESNNGTTLKIGITSAYKPFLIQIQDFLNKHNIKCSILESNRNKNPIYDLLVYKSEDIVYIYENLYLNAHFFLKRKEEKFGPLLKKFGKCRLTNSGNENENSNPEPSFTISSIEGAETRRE